MDSFEASNIVFSRIRKTEPENLAKKIVGVLLLEDSGQEMIRLAYGPESYIHSLVTDIKFRLGLIPNQIDSSSPSAPQLDQMAHWRMGSPSFVPPQPPLPIDVLRHNQNQNQNHNQESLNLGGMSNEYPLNYYFNSRKRECERPVKTCQYFLKGNCRNGNNCRYSHLYPTDHALGGEMFLPGSLHMLESDIYELLKSRKNCGPVSIASLPSLYQEKYGRSLQAEGYLTESQRHGKAGYNLTRLLARLKCIHIIDRPHGQHAVILAEDESKYFRENRRETNKHGRVANGSRQIYLTFPADSAFTEDDVSDYFSNYGTVEDVRIPWQEQRMFGFVNFASPDTVTMVLDMPNPHFVCGARVLVKAYREKSQAATNRNHQPNRELASSMTSDFHSGKWRAASMLSRQIKDRENEILKSLDELCIGQIPLRHVNLGYAAIDDQKPFDNEADQPSERQFNHIVDVDLSNGWARQDNLNHHGTNYIAHNSEETSFPDSLFDYPEGSSISTVARQQEQN